MPFLLLWHPKSTAGPQPAAPDLDGDRPRARMRKRDDDEATMLAVVFLRVISERNDG